MSGKTTAREANGSAIPQTAGAISSPGVQARKTSGNPLPCIAGSANGCPSPCNRIIKASGSISSPIAENAETDAPGMAPTNPKPCSASLAPASAPCLANASARTSLAAVRTRLFSDFISATAHSAPVKPQTHTRETRLPLIIHNKHLLSPPLGQNTVDHYMRLAFIQAPAWITLDA
jgi:hypothetical protein